MKPIYYLFYGIILCLYLLFTGYMDFSFVSAMSTGKWGPKGHSSYHK